MKKYITWSMVFVMYITTLPVYGQSFSEVHKRLLSNGLTTLNEGQFRKDDHITRGEVAKFFAQFAQIQHLPKVKSDEECFFTDIEGYDSTLTPFIIEACTYGLVQGTNNAYFPQSKLTGAEALTVIIRAMLGVQNETQTPRRRTYYQASRWLGLVNESDAWEHQTITMWNINTPATREHVGTWLFRTQFIDPTQLTYWPEISITSVYIKDLLRAPEGTTILVDPVSLENCYIDNSNCPSGERPVINETQEKISYSLASDARITLLKFDDKATVHRIDVDLDLFAERENKSVIQAMSDLNAYEVRLKKVEIGLAYDGPPDLFYGRGASSVVDIWHDQDTIYRVEEIYLP